MLDVAVARIQREGMRVALDNVAMEEVIAEAGVSRATAYRRWPTRDAFLTDVLVETVRRTALMPETAEDVARLDAVIDVRPKTLVSAQARRDLVVEALRISGDLDIRRVLASPSWRTYFSLSASHLGLAGGVRDEVGAALAQAAREFDARRAEIYASLAELLGYRLTDAAADEDGYRQLAEAAGAMMTGIITRALVDPAWLDRREERTLFGASRSAPWSSPERHLVGVVLAALEPDPTITWTVELVEDRLTQFRRRVAELLG